MYDNVLFLLTQEIPVQIPLHRVTDSANNGSVFPVVMEHFSASSDHALLMELEQMNLLVFFIIQMEQKQHWQ